MRRMLVIVCMTVIIFLGVAFVFWGLACACDGPNRFAGINPFRDRAPERVAQRFFTEISSGQCVLEDEVLCRQELRSGHVAEWKFVTRETKVGKIVLYYDVRYEDPAGWPASVSLTIQPASSEWKIVSYSGIH